MRKRIGEILVEAGAVSAEDVRRALAAQAGPRAGRRLGEILLAEKRTTPEALARALATQFELPFVRLPELDGPVSSAIPVGIQVQHRVIIFAVEEDQKVKRLHLALEDPHNQELVDELQFQLAMSVKIHVAASDDLARALEAIQNDGLETVAGEVLETSGTFELKDEVELTPIPAPLPQPRPATLEAPLEVPLPAEWAEPVPPPARVAVMRFGEQEKPWPTQVEKDLVAQRPVVPQSVRPVAAAPAPAPPASLRPVVAAPAAAGAPPAARAIRPVEVATLRATPMPGLAPAATVLAAAPTKLEFSDADLKVLDSLERMARGEPATLESEKVKPAQMVAALIRLLIRKGVIQELEFLEELSRK